MERTLELVVDDRQTGAVEVLQRVREGQSDGPGRRDTEQARMALEERPEAIAPRIGREIEQHDATVAVEADRQGAGQVADGRWRRVGGRIGGGLGRCRSGQPLEVRALLRRSRQPVEIRRGEHRVEQHQPLGRTARGHRAPIPARALADRRIQAARVHVIQPRAVVDASDRGGESPAHEPREERVALPAAIGDAGEARVLPRNADAGVPHDEHEEARLAFGEPHVGDGADLLVRCGCIGFDGVRMVPHRHSSSANPPCRPLPLPPPLRPLMRRLIPR